MQPITGRTWKFRAGRLYLTSFAFRLRDKAVAFEQPRALDSASCSYRAASQTNNKKGDKLGPFLHTHGVGSGRDY